MLSRLFLGLSLVGAEWVLYLLLVISVISVGIILERILFYRKASQGLADFREKLRTATAGGNLGPALEAARIRAQSQDAQAADLESPMAVALLSNAKASTEVLNEVAQAAVVRA